MTHGRNATGGMNSPPHPGEVLAGSVLSEISLADLAKHLRISHVELSNVVDGSAALTADLAIRLAATMGGSAESWLQMQAAYDLWCAHKQERPRIMPLRLAASAGRVERGLNEEFFDALQLAPVDRAAAIKVLWIAAKHLRERESFLDLPLGLARYLAHAFEGAAQEEEPQKQINTLLVLLNLKQADRGAPPAEDSHEVGKAVVWEMLAHEHRTRLRKQGEAIAVVAKRLGLSVDQVTRRYRNFMKRERKRARS